MWGVTPVTYPRKSMLSRFGEVRRAVYIRAVARVQTSSWSPGFWLWVVIGICPGGTDSDIDSDLIRARRGRRAAAIAPQSA